MLQLIDSTAMQSPLPAGEAFSSGRLLMTTEQSLSPAVAPVDSWAADPVNIALVVVALLVLLFLRRIVDVLGWLWQGAFSFRKLLAMQQSMRLIRERNSITLVMSYCLCLVSSRYGLYTPDLIMVCSPGKRSLLTMAALLLAALFRLLLLIFLTPPLRVGHETMASANHCIADCLILCSAVLVPLCPILGVFGAEGQFIRTIAHLVMFTFYVLFLVRKGQFLSKDCKQMSTVLYLCGLEILPVGALVLSAMFL